MADYSYWRMVIDFSIAEAIIGRQPFCEETHECSKCHRTRIQHNPVDAKEWARGRLLEIIGDAEKVDQYMKIIWTVRQSIRHKAAHESDYPHQRPASQLQPGDNELDIDTVVNNFKTDSHALEALETNMHEVTRILLLDNILYKKIFSDIRPYMIRSGGDELGRVYEVGRAETIVEPLVMPGSYPLGCWCVLMGAIPNPLQYHA